jgi:hypothetical protein
MNTISKPLHNILLKMMIEMAVIEQSIFQRRQFSKERMCKRNDGIAFAEKRLTALSNFFLLQNPGGRSLNKKAGSLARPFLLI